MYDRLFKCPKQFSFFLFGARGTGKSTLLGELFKTQRVIWIDLLDQDVLARYDTDPMLLERELESRAIEEAMEWVVIDEIQKVPPLLDVVHRIIEKKRFKFALSGSSARKLKRGAANLLAGRALENFLFPLTFVELGKSFGVDFVLRWGSLPAVFAVDEDERQDYLRTYTNTYLKEEVQVEQLVRQLPPFRLFLEVAAQCSGTIVNYSKIARDIGSDPVSVTSYFSILEDTLLGFYLPSFERSIRKRQRKNPKFYLFDLGVQRALRKHLHIPLATGTYEYGNAFEQWVVLEMSRLNHYYRHDWQFSYLQTKDGVEVDLVIERPGKPLALVEIKSTKKVKKEDVRSLLRIGCDIKNSELYCLSQDSISQKIDNVHCSHWKEGFALLGLV